MLKYFQSEDGKRDSKEKPVQEEKGRCSDSETPGASESSIFQVEQGSGVDLPESEIKDLDVIDQHEVAEQGEETPKIVVNKELKSHDVEETLQEQDIVEEPSHGQEKSPIHREFLSNPNIVVDEISGTFDPASVVGLNLSTEEKEKLIIMKPCQPNQQILKLRTKQFGERSRYCSQQVFFHDDDTRRKWISYSLSTDSLFCIPCLLFTDALSRGELARANQGNAFTFAGFSNWKKQHSVVKNHEMSAAHANGKVAEVLFLQEKTIASRLEQQGKDEAARRKVEVTSNQNIMT